MAPRTTISNAQNLGSPILQIGAYLPSATALSERLRLLCVNFGGSPLCRLSERRPRIPHQRQDGVRPVGFRPHALGGGRFCGRLDRCSISSSDRPLRAPR